MSENRVGFNRFGVRRFQEFSTIDWVQDSFVERSKRRSENEWTNHSSSLSTWFLKLYEAAQTWLVLVLVGTAIGLNAAFISIITAWLSDLKMGYCQQGWWLNQKFCCWEIEANSNLQEEKNLLNSNSTLTLGSASGIVGLGGTEEGCHDWITWTEFLPIRYLVYVFYSVLFSYFAAKLVNSFSTSAAGSGISEIKCILSGFNKSGYLSFITLGIKSIALPLAIASGLSVGKEGPSVHVAASIGNVIGGTFQKINRNRHKMREVVTAASAAGVAVAFGSPVGGVLFAFEEMTVNFPIKTMWKSFFCALVATVTLSAMNPFRTGKLVLFQVSYDRDWHFFELGFFILIGLFGGLYGAFVIKYNLQVATFRRNHLSNSAISEVVILSTITALIGYFNKFLRIDMTESLDILFRECEGGGDYDGLCQSWAQWQMVNSLLLATVIRTCLVVLSYGCRVPAGIFVPSMAVGATFGRMVGILVKALYMTVPHWTIFAACDPEKPCITPGTYALLGAAAALGGIMRITVTVVVIMFELTGALTYILPTMIVLMVTKAVSDQLVNGHGGIADQMIRLNGFPCLEKEDHVYGIAVGEMMTGKGGGIRMVNQVESSIDLIKENEGSSRVRSVESGLDESLDQVLVLPSQLPLRDLRDVLGSERWGPGQISGWPIVKGPGDLRIVGYVASEALFEAVDHASSFRPNCLVTFCRSSTLDEPIESSDTQTSERLDLSYLVNPSALRVSPKQPLEMVMSLFKKMGPRTILIESSGKLVGLVTLKDVLRFEIESKELNFINSKFDETHDGLQEVLIDSQSLVWEVFNGIQKWIKG
ncbi:chloride channel [Melampsora americana]|nr:chloride channel [Melampsora americana]